MRFLPVATLSELAALAAAVSGRRRPRRSAADRVQPLDRVRQWDIAALDHWLTRRYGPGPFPAAIIGSGSGAVTQLAAALGAPLLPQTTRIAVPLGRIRDSDQARAALAPLARQVTWANPELAMHVLPDPAGRPVAGFWCKRRRLGQAYRRLLLERLPEGATILQVECTGQVAARPIGERGWFQPGEQLVGGVGAGRPVDWAPASAVREARARSGDRPPRLRTPSGEPRVGRRPKPGQPWQAPEPLPAPDSGEPDSQVTVQPAAAWGWDPALAEEISQLAHRRGLRVLRLACTHPGQHSGFIADLHRWWYREQGRRDDQLLAATAVPADLRWPHRAGLVPYWLASAREAGYGELIDHLESTRPYEVIYLRPAPDSVPPARSAPGELPVRRWRDLLDRHALRRGAVVADCGWTVPEVYPDPEPLTVEQMSHFLRHSGGRYPLTLHYPD